MYKKATPASALEINYMPLAGIRIMSERVLLAQKTTETLSHTPLSTCPPLLPNLTSKFSLSSRNTRLVCFFK